MCRPSGIAVGASEWADRMHVAVPPSEPETGAD